MSPYLPHQWTEQANKHSHVGCQHGRAGIMVFSHSPSPAAVVSDRIQSSRRMQRTALNVLRSLGNNFRIVKDETVLRQPKFVRSINPELSQEFEDFEYRPQARLGSDEQDVSSSIPEHREPVESPGTSYSLPHLRADIEQQRYPVSALHALKRQGLLNLDPEYQRGFVWDKAASSRLVETILLGLPVPEIWVHEHPSGSGRLDIVDGKQRITSLLSFLDGTFPRHSLRFTLEGLETLEQLNGKTREELSQHEQQSLQQYPLSLRILGRNSGAKAVFEIYKRINSGGENLNDQQARKAAFWSPYMRLLNELAENETLKRVRGAATTDDEQESDRELILRFFAMHGHMGTYSMPLSNFLNDEADRGIGLSDAELQQRRSLFERAIGNVWAVFGEGSFRADSAKLEPSLWDTLLVTFSRYEPGQLAGKEEALREDFRKVLKHRDFKLRLSAANLAQRQELYDKRVAAIVGKAGQRKA